MAPTPAGFGSAASADGVSLSVPVPAGVVAGDLVVIAFHVGSPGTTLTLPAGFLQAEASPSAASNIETQVWYRRATGSESGTYTVSISPSGYASGVAGRFTGVVASGNPFDTGCAAANSGTTGVSTSPAVSITTAGAERLVLHIPGNWSGGTWTPHTGFTNHVRTSFDCVMISSAAQAVAGSTGTVQATCSATDKMTAWLGALIPDSGGSTQTVTATGIATAEAVGSPTVTPGAVSVALSSVATAEVFGTPVISASGTTTVVASGIASGEALGSPTVTPGAVAVTAVGIDSAEQFGTATVTARGLEWRLVHPQVTDRISVKGSLLTKQVRELTVFGDLSGLYTSEDGGNVPEDSVYVWRGGYENTTTSEAIKDLWLANGFTVELI